MPFHPARAQQLSNRVGRIPFGFPTLDGRFDGIPAGTASLLAGSPDAGTDAFAYSHAARLMQLKHGNSRSVGQMVQDRIPETVHYVSLNHSRSRILHGMDAVLGPGQFNLLVEHLSITDLSDEFFDVAPVPDALRLAADETPAAELDATPGSEASFEQFLDNLATHLETIGDDNLVILDSLTAFQRARHFGMDWGNALGLLEGLRHAASEWGGLVDVLYHARPEQVRNDETTNTALDGSFYFYTNDRGTRAQKTMRVGDFNGSLSRGQQVVYDTRVTDDGFQIGASRSI